MNVSEGNVDMRLMFNGVWWKLNPFGREEFYIVYCAVRHLSFISISKLYLMENNDYAWKPILENMFFLCSSKPCVYKQNTDFSVWRHVLLTFVWLQSDFAYILETVEIHYGQS